MPGFNGYGGGGGYMGGNGSFGYSAPQTGYSGLGAGAGTQGLPYGQGFNQITGAPMGSINQGTYMFQQQQKQNAAIQSAINDFLKSGSSGASSQSGGYAPVSFAPQSYGQSAQAVSLIGSGGVPAPTQTGSVTAPSSSTGLRTSASPAVGGASPYTDILQSYADMEAALEGQGQAQLADIARRYGGYEGKTVQNAISRGLAPQYAPVGTFEAGRAGTPLASMLRGLRYDQEAANRAAMEGINSQRAGITQQRLSAAERMQQSLAQQQYQSAQLDLERQRLAQQDAQFKASLANQFRTSVGFGGGSSGGSGGGGGGSRGGIPNIGQTTNLNNGQMDRYGYYGGNIPNNIPSGVLGGMYTGSGGDYFGGYSPAPYAELPGATYDFGMGGGGYGGDWGTGFDYMGG